jgi:ATP-dependent RNA helicase MSS116
MFSACRRGPASISKILTRASSNILRIPSTRPSTLSISQATAKTLQEARLIHISSKLRAAYQSTNAREYAEETQQTQQQDELEPITQFAQLKELNMVHPNVINVITREMKIETMTEVQSATIHQGLQGSDM